MVFHKKKGDLGMRLCNENAGQIHTQQGGHQNGSTRGGNCIMDWESFSPNTGKRACLFPGSSPGRRRRPSATDPRRPRPAARSPVDGVVVGKGLPTYILWVVNAAAVLLYVSTRTNLSRQKKPRARLLRNIFGGCGGDRFFPGLWTWFFGNTFAWLPRT